MLSGPAHREPSLWHTPRIRHRYPQLSCEILPRDAVLIPHEVLSSPLSNNLSSVLPCAGPDIHNPVCGAHGILIMLHHEHRVSKIPEMLQRPEQLVIVPLMQAYARLIQYVGNSNQSRADLRRETYALCLAAGERPGRPGQCEVIKPHINKKGDAIPNLLQNLLAYHPLHLCERELINKAPEFHDRHVCRVINIQIAHRHREAGTLQPFSAAGLTGNNAHKGLILLLCARGKCFSVAALFILDQPLEGDVIDPFSALAPVAHLHLCSAGSVEQNVPYLLRIVLKGCIQTEVIMLRQCREQCVCKASLLITGVPARRNNCPLIDRETLVRHHELQVKLHLVTETQTIRTGPKGIVEGKAPGLHLFDGDPAVRAGKAL